MPGPAGAAAPPLVLPPRLWIILVLLSWLCDPLTWCAGSSSLWFVPAGLGFVYVAWFGPRGALAVLLGRALAVGLAWMRSSFPNSAAIALAWIDVPLTAAEALAAWTAFRRGKPSRGLADPRSAILFLLLVPGVCALLFALARTGLHLAVRGRRGIQHVATRVLARAARL